MLTFETSFDFTCIHLILSDHLSTTDIEKLNKTSKTFSHFHKISSHTELCMFFKLFKDDTDYLSQTSIHIERTLQLISLAVTYILHVPSIILSLTGNCKASYIDPDTMIQEYKYVLHPDLLAQIKLALNYYNPTKFVGHVIAEKLRHARACGNHASVTNNVPKVESTLSKEEREKCVIVFLRWIEQLFPDFYLTPQDIVCKKAKVIASSSTDPFWRPHFRLHQPICVHKRPKIKLQCTFLVCVR